MNWRIEEALMSLMPEVDDRFVGRHEDAWLHTDHTLFVRTAHEVVKLAEGWRQVPHGFAGRVDGTDDRRVMFVPMTSVVQAWQFTACPVRSSAPAYDYDKEPF